MTDTPVVLEALEPRLLLSGSQVGAALTLVGANSADSISIGPGSALGEVVAFGVDGVADGTTFTGVDQITIRGRSGDDLIWVGTGILDTFGAAIGVSIDGDGGDDWITGGDGDDDIDGGEGNDYVNGGAGDDNVSGGSGKGKDVLFGYSGDDTIEGGLGKDTIIGSGGTDTVRSGAGKKILLFDGLANGAGGSGAIAPAAAVSGPTISFQTSLSLVGSMFGFSGVANAAVSVSGTLSASGIISGALTASGGGTAAGDGCTATFGFSASGTVAGTLSSVLISAGWSGSGTAHCPDGDHAGSSSGNWSGTTSLASTKNKQKLASTTNKDKFKGSMPVTEFTTSSPVDDAVGGTTARSSFSSSKLGKAETDTVTDRLDEFTDANQRNWILKNVRLMRGKVKGSIPPFPMSVSPKGLTFQDNFFVTDEFFTQADQTNLVAFESGKAFWFGKINKKPPGKKVTVREADFQDYADRHETTIAAMKNYALYGGKDLSELSDNDYQSKFAYIYRVSVLDISPPAAPPAGSGYSVGQWNAIKDDWAQVKKDFKARLDDLLAAPSK